MGEKRTAAVYSKYDASEKTLCALYLSEYLYRRSKRVFWVVPDVITVSDRYRGFSHKWDTSVLPLSCNARYIQKSLEKDVNGNHCEICFFLDESELMLSLLPKVTKTAVFLDPHTWRGDTSRAFVKKCTYPVSLSPSLKKQFTFPNLFSDSILCPFDSSVQMMPHTALQSGESATLFYPAYDMTFYERRCVQQIADIVKRCCPKSKSVIGYYDKNDTSEAGRDARVYDWKLLDYLRQADWIVDLNPRPLMGLFASFAGSRCIQWSGFDIPPNSDEYSAARRHLIPFPKEGLVPAHAVEIAEHIVRHLTLPFNDDLDRNKGAGAYNKRLSAFSNAINKMLGVRKSKFAS